MSLNFEVSAELQNENDYSCAILDYMSGFSRPKLLVN